MTIMVLCIQTDRLRESFESLESLCYTDSDYRPLSQPIWYWRVQEGHKFRAIIRHYASHY